LAIECGNLAKNIAAAGVAKGKRSTLSGEHGEPDAAFHDKVQSFSRVSSSEDKLTRLKGGFAHLCSHSAAVCLTERAKQVCTTEKCCYQRNLHHVILVERSRRDASENRGEHDAVNWRGGRALKLR
jgi:hypothetical protein